ncbi:MAG: ABC transporter substrate-binding protein [Pseudolabrys sp.]
MRMFKAMIGGLVLAAAATTAQAQDKITYNMAWLPQGSSVGVAVALDKGWFKEGGIDVSIIRGYGGNRTANELDQGQFEVGYVDPISLVLNRANGGKIKMIGVINARWPAGICYAPSRHNVKGLEGLRGLTMGGGSASPVQNVVPAWLELNGLPRDAIRMLRMDPAVVDTSFVEGKIDLAECWLASNRAVIHKQAKAAGLEVKAIEYSDYKLDAYGSGFAAREELIKSKPEVLRKFLQASYRGFEFAKSNPDAAADAMIKQFPTLDRVVVLEQIKDINSLIVEKDTKMGSFQEGRMASTVSFVDKAFDLKGKVAVKDTFTNELLGK